MYSVISILTDATLSNIDLSTYVQCLMEFKFIQQVTKNRELCSKIIDPWGVVVKWIEHLLPIQTTPRDWGSIPHGGKIIYANLAILATACVFYWSPGIFIVLSVIYKL